MKKNRKTTIEEAAKQLTVAAEHSLSVLPEEEQDARVAAFARRSFKASRGSATKASKRDRTPASRAASRGR